MPPTPHVLELPRVSPYWEFYSNVALVKPQYASRVRHARVHQRPPRNFRGIIRDLCGVEVETSAELLARIRVAGSERQALRVALRISSALPTLWFRFNGRLVHAGRFYRTQGRYRLVPCPSPTKRLPFDIFRLVVGMEGSSGYRAGQGWRDVPPPRHPER